MPKAAKCNREFVDAMHAMNECYDFAKYCYFAAKLVKAKSKALRVLQAEFNPETTRQDPEWMNLYAVLNLFGALEGETLTFGEPVPRHPRLPQLPLPRARSEFSPEIDVDKEEEEPNPQPQYQFVNPEPKIFDEDKDFDLFLDAEAARNKLRSKTPPLHAQRPAPKERKIKPTRITQKLAADAQRVAEQIVMTNRLNYFPANVTDLRVTTRLSDSQ